MSGDPAYVLAVDLDGVCADHTAAFRQVVAAELDVDPATLGPQHTWNFHEWGLTDADFDRLHRIGVLEHRMFTSMPPIAGVGDALWRLSDAGVWIRIVTHRLWTNWGHAIAVGDTVAWLDAHAIPYRDLCFLGDKPAVEADLYIEDAPHNVEALRASGNTVVVFDQPYNRELAGPRAASWAEVEPLVVEHRLAVGQAVQQPLLGLNLPRKQPMDRVRRAARDRPT